MKRLYYFNILLPVIFAACNNSYASDTTGLTPQKTVRVDYSRKQSLADFYETVSDIELIRLETSDDILVNKPYKVKENNGCYFFLDKIRDRIKLFCFDQNGKLKYSIDRQGRGPGEYLFLQDYDIYRDKIYMLDKIGGKILTYNSNTGEYIATINNDVKKNYESICFINENFFALFTRGMHSYINRIGDNDCVHIFNTNGERVHHFLKMEESYNKRMENHQLEQSVYRMNDTLYATMPFDNRVFAITPDNVAIKYSFEFDRTTAIEKYIKDNEGLGDDEFYEKWMKADVPIIEPTFIEKTDYVICRASTKSFYLLVWDKTNNSTQMYIYNFPKWYQLMGAGNPIYDGADNSLIGIISPVNISSLEYVDLNSNVYRVGKQLSEMEIKEDDNPLLIKFKLQHPKQD